VIYGIGVDICDVNRIDELNHVVAMVIIEKEIQ